MKTELTPAEQGKNLEDFVHEEKRRKRTASITDQEVDELARASGCDRAQARAVIIARIGREMAMHRKEAEERWVAAAKAEHARQGDASAVDCTPGTTDPPVNAEPETTRRKLSPEEVLRAIDRFSAEADMESEMERFLAMSREEVLQELLAAGYTLEELKAQEEAILGPAGGPGPSTNAIPPKETTKS